ncbi:MAG: hypothetical protein KDD69_13660, partial [Bdellovibrionales bacterium]|nr:hypothetical protein [Bdellovibrionales bacterium]
MDERATPLSNALRRLANNVLERQALADGPVILVLQTDSDIRKLLLDGNQTAVRWVRALAGRGYSGSVAVRENDTEILNGRRGYGVTFALSKVTPNPVTSYPVAQNHPRQTAD